MAFVTATPLAKRGGPWTGRARSPRSPRRPRPASTSTTAVAAPSRVASIAALLASEKLAVEQALDLSMPARDARTARIVEAMRYSLLAGGKRLRPVLVLAAFDMFAAPGADRDAAAMPAALAVEMIHTMSLIHDDLPAMDNDDLRRGRPTCHKVYGEDTAILAGDAMLAYAYEYVARETRGVDPARVLRVVSLLAECVGAEGLAGGQVMDLQSEGRDDVTLEDLTWIHTHKTAALLRVSVAAGAILAGAEEEDVQRVTEFAVKIGLAFQIADDVLDVTSTSEKLGKTAGKDEATDKATYPRLMGLEQARGYAERLVTEAKDCLKPYGARAETLLGLADFIIYRAS